MNEVQLVNSNKTKINPKTTLESIKTSDGRSLAEVLAQINCYFVTWQGSVESTRLAIDEKIRRQGFWLTWSDALGEVKTEVFTAQDVQDDAWANNSNWVLVPLANTTINENGDTLINALQSTMERLNSLEKKTDYEIIEESAFESLSDEEKTDKLYYVIEDKED